MLHAVGVNYAFDNIHVHCDLGSFSVKVMNKKMQQHRLLANFENTRLFMSILFFPGE